MDDSKRAPVQVAIVGLGTVGSGVARLLDEFGQRTARHAGRPLVLKHVVVRDAKKPRQVKLPAATISTDLGRITDDADVSIVALLVGGLEPARTYMLKLLESGKDVVTANKALLAEHGPELFDRARRLGRSIAFEAAVAGGIPIIANISTCLSANQIESIHAILNGTSNYILTQMEARGAAYADAVAEAQRLGFAEADPSMDVDGSDAAQKLAILAHLAFGARVAWHEIPRRGIDTLDQEDLRLAKELGYRIKLLAVARATGGRLETHVSPALVKLGTPLAEVRGAYNAVSVVGDAVGRVFYSGLGAGQMPTASAVMADMIDMAAGRAAITFRHLNLWSDEAVPIAQGDFGDVAGRFYLRFNVEDRPSVLAEIATILGRENISIASVIQHEAADESGVVPLVVMTHKTNEGATNRATDVIDRLPFMRGGSVRMRVHE
ncbi:MAG TPA: homoserine dehydrogenase [Pirellulales bacterium]|jgi:homoserine dehydrogenase|nr:homoserine dehydrogenase [Pirellulales bacterium]